MSVRTVTTDSTPTSPRTDTTKASSTGKPLSRLRERVG